MRALAPAPPVRTVSCHCSSVRLPLSAASAPHALPGGAPDRGHEPEIVEDCRSKIERQVTHSSDGLIDQLDALAGVGPVLLQIEAEGGEHLSEVIMDLARDRAPLGLLRLDQPSRKRGQLLALAA